MELGRRISVQPTISKRLHSNVFPLRYDAVTKFTNGWYYSVINFLIYTCILFTIYCFCCGYCKAHSRALMILFTVLCLAMLVCSLVHISPTFARYSNIVLFGHPVWNAASSYSNKFNAASRMRWTVKMLNLENLQSRRTRFDLFMCYKIIFGLVCVYADIFLSFM